MLVPGHPSCPWSYRENVPTFVAAQTGAGILTCKRGYFFARHPLHTYVWWRFSFYVTFINSCNFQLETMVMQMDTDLPRRPLIPRRRFCGYVGLSLWIPHCQRGEKIVQDAAIVLRDEPYWTSVSPQIHRSPRNQFHFIRSLAHAKQFKLNKLLVNNLRNYLEVPPDISVETRKHFVTIYIPSGAYTVPDYATRNNITNKILCLPYVISLCH